MNPVVRLIGTSAFAGVLAAATALQTDSGNYQAAVLAFLIATLSAFGFGAATPFNKSVGVGKESNDANVGGGGGLDGEAIPTTGPVRAGIPPVKVPPPEKPQ